MPLYTYYPINKTQSIYRFILRIAQFESEIELGVNPLNIGQAKVSKLSAADFGYLDRVNDLVNRRMHDENWLKETSQYVQQLYSPIDQSNLVQFNDELFKAGRGILQDHLVEMS